MSAIPIVPPRLTDVHAGEIPPLLKTFEKRHFKANIYFGATFFLLTMSVIVLISTCLCFTIPGVNAVVLLPGIIPSAAGTFVGLCLCGVVTFLMRKRNIALAELLNKQKAIIDDPQYALEEDDQIAAFIENHFLTQKNTAAKVNLVGNLLHKFKAPKGVEQSARDAKIQNCLEKLKKEIPKSDGKKEKAKFEASKKGIKAAKKKEKKEKKKKI